METLADCNQPPEILEAITKMIKNPRGFFVLAGKNGTGKTFAAKVIYNAIARYRLPAYDHEDAYFANQADLNFEYNRLYKLYGEVHEFLSTLRKTRILVIDDLGTRTPSEAFMDFLYSIIDYRYNKALATIITTNLTSKDMREKFGDAFVSRTCSGKVFRLEGTDRRFKDF